MYTNILLISHTQQTQAFVDQRMVCVQVLTQNIALWKLIDTNKQVRHQQIAVVFKYEAQLLVSATVHCHLRRVSVLKDKQNVTVQLVSNER